MINRQLQLNQVTFFLHLHQVCKSTVNSSSQGVAVLIVGWLNDETGIIRARNMKTFIFTNENDHILKLSFFWSRVLLSSKNQFLFSLSSTLSMTTSFPLAFRSPDCIFSGLLFFGLSVVAGLGTASIFFD